MSERTCRKGLHAMTPENTMTCGRCRACKKAWLEARPGYSTEGVRRYRQDPERRELDRERSRRWKREHLGQPGLPREGRVA
jgi:hypothetical protein